MEDDIDERPSFMRRVKDFFVEYRAILVVMLVIMFVFGPPLNIGINISIIVITVLYKKNKKREEKFFNRVQRV